MTLTKYGTGGSDATMIPGRRKEYPAIIKVSPLFRKKLNLMKINMGYPNLVTLTKDLADSEDFDKSLDKNKKKRDPNPFYPI